MNSRLWLQAGPFAALIVGAACSSGTPTNTVSGGSGESTGSAGGSGNGGVATTGAGSGAGGAASGSIATAGSTSGATTPSSGVMAAAGSVTGAGSGVGGVTGSVSGAGTSSGAPSGSMASGASSGTGVPSTSRHGQSMGCGATPVGANSGNWTDHIITLPVCPGTCVEDGGAPAAGTPSYPDCVDPCFAPGAPSSQMNGGETFLRRDYTIELPANYDPSTPYPLFLGGGGCGGSPPQTGAGFDVGSTGAIKIGLQYVNGCFADGGSACSGPQNLEPSCVRGPELPYVRAVIAAIEAGFCVDLSKEFIGGYSSGGWEAFTSGCGAANLLRGFVSEEGGWRQHQPACTGPIAALMVAGEADTVNPIGPLPMIDTDLDSFGSAPGRDEVLTRNGCTGTATTMYDSKYPDCVQYTGCPAAYPVVWCPLPGAGHNDSSAGGINYSPGSVQGDPLMWKFLSSLPAAP